jgi:NTE family protein
VTADPLDVGCNAEVGLVLAGGGARGAYEAGALATLLPYLEQRGERPGVVLGTSIGALNGSFLAATAHVTAAESLDSLIELWRDVQFSDIVGPVVSPRELGRVLLYIGGLLGIPRSRVPALLDTTRLSGVVRSLIDFDQLHRNVDQGLVSLAVVATSYATGQSVVFHDGPPGVVVQTDVRRAIRYVPSRVDGAHVHASASIPVAFSATRVDQPSEAAAWYGDGGTRLNTPIKPALKLGAKRVVVIGLNSSAPPSESESAQPDVFDGAAQVVQALLADPLAQDVATLSSVNREVVNRDDNALPEDAHQPVPYIFVAPRDRLTVGEVAAETFRDHLSGVKAIVRARDLATLGHILGAGNNAVRGELFSALFFATEFHNALIELGRRDAERWLSMTHDDGPWRLGRPPLPPPPRPRPSPKAARSRRARAADAA